MPKFLIGQWRSEVYLQFIVVMLQDNRNLPPNNEALLHYGIGSSRNDSIQAHKRLRTEHS